MPRASRPAPDGWPVCAGSDWRAPRIGYGRPSPTSVGKSTRMEFGILFTSHPHKDREPYPHRAVHARVTDEIVAADRLGFDTAWLAEHHFSTEYGIMPDVWVYAGHLAALTEAHQARHGGRDAAARQPGAGGGERRVRRHPERRARGPRTGLGLSQVRVRRVRARLRGAPRHAGRGAGDHARSVPHGAKQAQGCALHDRHCRRLRAAAASDPEAVSAAVPGGCHRPLDRHGGALGVRAHALDADAVRHAGHAR